MSNNWIIKNHRGEYTLSEVTSDSMAYYTMYRPLGESWVIWCHTNSRMRDIDPEGPRGKKLIAVVEAFLAKGECE